MNIRASILVGMVAVTAPIAIGAFDLLPSPLGTSVAQAQPSDAATTLAREKFTEGVKAYDAQRFEEARSLFLQSYAITRHPGVLLNLGLAELKTGHNTDAGNHLQQFLREHRAAPEDQRQAARVGISDAQKRTGHIVVIVDVDGAQVAIDDVSVGTSPLLDPIFVEPGEHTVTATMSGRTARTKLNAPRGTAAAANLGLRALGVSAPAAPPGPAPTGPSPAPTSTGGGAPPGTGTTGYQPPPAYPPPAATPSGTATGFTSVPPPTSGSGRQGFFDWYTKKPFAWVLTGLAGVGLIGTVGFGIAAGVADGSVTDQTDYILNEVERNDENPASEGYLTSNWYQDGEPKPCGPEDQPAKDHPYYHSNCEVLRDNIATYDLDVSMAVVSAVVLGASVAGTVIYYFVDADTGAAQATSNGVRLVGVAPIITETDRGIGVVGTF